MGSLVFTQSDNGDLVLIAEVEDIADPALAIDALLDEVPDLITEEFVVIDTEHRIIVKVDDLDLVRPRRDIVVIGGTNGHGPDEDEAPAPKRRGRPPGTKSKTADAPKRRGRPPGTKNKPKADAEETPKRRGRPPGSKNKPKAAATSGAKRGPGRPRGSSFKRNESSDE
jgi:hypothetical protein